MGAVVDVWLDLSRPPAAFPLDFRVLREHQPQIRPVPMVSIRAEGAQLPQYPDSITHLAKKAVEYTTWEHGWDGAGAEQISALTVRNVIGILKSTFSEIDLPYIAPAMTGEILVQWAFGDYDFVEIYVGEIDVFPADAHVEQNRNISAHLLADVDELIALLAKVQARS